MTANPGGGDYRPDYCPDCEHTHNKWHEAELQWAGATYRAEMAEAQVARVEALADWLFANHDDSLVTSDYPMIGRRLRAALADPAPKAPEGGCGDCNGQCEKGGA